MRRAEPEVAFQVWMVLQLLGVIVAAIAIAAMFSVLGLGLVRVLSWPWRDHASTFVAWSFLRASRLEEPLLTRLWWSIREAFDAGPLAARGYGLRRAGFGALLLIAGAGAAVWSQLEAGAGDSGGLVGALSLVLLRNLGVAAALHGLLLAASSPPWRPLRLALPALVLVALLAALTLLDQLPPLAALGGGFWRLVPLLLGAGAVVQVSRLPRQGRDRVARRVGLVVLAGALVAAGVGLAAGSWVVAAQAGGLLLGAALLLLLHGAARVSVPVFVAIVGVAAGTWALIVVLSVMGGFASDLRAKMLVANAHALVQKPGGAAPIQQAAQLSARLRAVQGVAAVSPQVHGDAILGSSFNVHNFVSLRGVDPALPEVQRAIGATVVSGSLALLARPEAMGRPSWRGQKSVDARDIPAAELPAPATSGGNGQAGVDERDIDALLQLAPGPAEVETPRPPIALPSGVAAMPGTQGAIDAGAADPGTLDPGALDPGALDPGALDLGGVDLGGGKVGEVKLDPVSGALPDVLALPTPNPGVDRLLEMPFDDEERDMPVAPGILLGVELARSLQVDLGDRVEVITPDADVGPTGLRPRLRTFRVAGTFETGLYEADSKVAYVDVAEASRYFNLDGAVNVVELRLDEPAAPDATLAQVRGALAGGPVSELQVVDWRELNRSLFSALAFERLVIFLVLGLIILVASFAIVSALTMVILQKRDGIAMLSAMGASARTIGSSFVQMGFVIGAIGTSAGLILGLGTCGLIATLGIKLPDAYYVRELPVEVIPAEVAAVVFASLAVSLVATAFPARTAARSRPLEGLRHD